MEKKYIIVDENGIHARPATVIVNEAAKYDSEITLIFNDQEVNLKSIMGVMSLGLQKDSEIIIKAEGDDQDLAIEKIGEVAIKEGLLKEI